MTTKKSDSKSTAWTCPKCSRIFLKRKQKHSCKSYPIENHFKNKDHAKELYDHLHKTAEKKVGKCKEISLQCCVHWFGNYDFIALLPKKDKLEVRFALDRALKKKRIFAAVPLSKSSWKNCLFLTTKDDVDDELIEWIKESYERK